MVEPPPERAHPRRILIVRLSHLGDVVHALPVFHALRAAHPAAELGWVVQREFAPLVRGHDEHGGLAGLSRVFEFDRRGGLGAWWRLRRELRAWAADWAVDVQGNVKSAAAVWCAGAPRRSGYAPSDWQEPFAARVLNDPAGSAYGVHAVHRIGALLAHVAPTAELTFDPTLTDAERARASEEWARRVPPGGGRAWLLHLGVAGDPRTWPSERFGALARLLGAAGDRVLVLSGPGEADAGERLSAELADDPRIRHWVGQRGVRDALAFFAEAASHGARLVVGDSGPSHLAAAVGLGVDLLSGPQDPARTGPWPLAETPGSPHRVLRAAQDRCAPLDALTVDRVSQHLRG